MMGREAVISHLVNWLEKGNEADRFYAIRTLTKLNAVHVSEQLIERLGDEDDDVCTEAAIALGKLACADAVSILIQAINEHHVGDVKIAATQALSNIGSEEALETLMSLAQSRPLSMDEDLLDGWDDYWDIQRIAVIALGEQKVSQAAPLLITLLSSDECQDLEPEILTALTKTGEAGIKYLCACLTTHPLRTVRRIVSALSQSEPQYHLSCINDLLALLEYKDPHIRLAVCQTLGHFSLPETSAILINHFVDSDTDVAEAAIRAVINIAQNQPALLTSISSHLLLTFAKEASTNSRKALLKIAGEVFKFGNEMNEADHKFLAELFSNNDDELSLLAAQLLCKDPNQTCQAALIEQLNNTELSSHTRRGIIHCYLPQLENSQIALIPLLALLDENDNIVRTAALDIIAKTALKPFIGDINPAEHAIYSFVLNQDVTVEKSETADNNTKNITLINKVTAEQVIPVAIIDDDNLPAIEPKSTLDSLLNNVKQNVSGEPIQEDILNENTEQTPEVISTLSSIRTVAINEPIDPAVKEKDQDQRLHQLLNEQPETMEEFNGIIRQNLKNGDQFGYSKKKIARIAIIENRILAAQSLAHYPVKSTVQLILESLRNPDIDMTVALLTALERIVASNIRISGLSNIVGICSTFVFGGNDEIKRLAAKILGQLKHRQAIPALHDAINCSDQNVRIQAIHSLSELLSKNAKRISTEEHVVRDENHDESRDEKTIRLVTERLTDDEYGVRHASVLFMQKHQILEIEMLVDLGCSDGGALTNVVGKALKIIDKNEATKVILRRLEQSKEFSQRQHLFHQLECLYETDSTYTVQ
jgi:HEAT repeat protein